MAQGTRVLVTGGAGFIGSHLVELLLDRGRQVTVLDDLSTGSLKNLPASDGRLRIVEGDLCDQNALLEALTGQDAFVHLAAVASVEASVMDPLTTHRTNLEGSIRLFDTAARLGVKRAIYASSAAVYGNNPNVPLTESDALNPLSPYAADKLAGEHYLAFYHRTGRLSATAFRFFNVYGPRQDPSSPYSGVISIFLDRAARSQPITVFGDGKQSRDFIFVRDVAVALLSALDSAPPEGEMPVFNVGGGKAISLLELLDAVARLPGVNSPLDLSFAQARQGDVRASLADTSSLRSTGWQPQTTLEEGLIETLNVTAIPQK